MSQNPFVNALAALLYIAVIASGMYYGPRYLGQMPDTVLIPIAFLSLFVLSAATMGYLFLCQPALLLLAGEQKKGVTLFLQTLGIFACITVVLLASLFLFAGVK